MKNAMRMVVLLLVLGLGVTVNSFAIEPSLVPDWAQRMSGAWQGKGVRVALGTGERTEVRVDVQAEWKSELSPPALVSRNQFRETVLDSNGNPIRRRNYLRLYWIREESRSGAIAELILGGGDGSSTDVASRGRYDADRQSMFVEQNLGPELRVSSESDMTDAQMTRYQEIFWINGVKKIASWFGYQRSS